MRNGHRRVVAVLVLVAAAGGGAAVAAIPKEDGTITGCYVPDGNLRITEQPCNKNELPLSWNQRGPQGPAGPAGSAGADGTTTTQVVNAEPPQIFEAVFDGSRPDGRASSLPQSGSPFDLALDLPAGTYIATAKTAMFGYSFSCYQDRCERGLLEPSRRRIGPVDVSCTFSAAGTSDQARNYFESDDTWAQPLSFTLDAPGRATLSCRLHPQERIVADESDYALVRSMRITATRLPQTTVTRRVVRNAVLAAMRGTTEINPSALERRIDRDAFKDVKRRGGGR